MSSYPPTAAILSAVGLSVIIIKAWKKIRTSPRNPYPPGPKPSFLIGNLRDMPTSYVWQTTTKWGQEYGPLTYLDVAGQPIIVVNNQKIAVDLLEKRAAIYSDRPRFVMAAELTGIAGFTVLKPYGPVLKKHRRMLTQALHPTIVQKDFVPLQERIARRFVQTLSDKPQDFEKHVHRLVGEIIQTVAYGAWQDGDVDLVDLGNANMHIFGKTVAGYMVDFLPFLKYIPAWFPGAKFKRDAHAWRKVTTAAREIPFNMVKRKKAQGESMPPSFTSALLDNAEVSGSVAEEEIIAGVAGTLFGGASDTIASTTLTFVLAMTLFPEVQAKAQAELDRVFGNRLPAYSGKASTPYLNALIQETLRWHPTGPNGVPHRLTQDDFYNEYLLPAGSIIIVNVWGILHDERRFPNHMKFDPERFIATSTAAHGKADDTHPIDPWDVAFGYGRRICPGISVAQAELWIVFATILSTVTIRPKTDPITGEKLLPGPTWTGENVSFPKPFACEIKPRSKEHAERLKEALAEPSDH